MKEISNLVLIESNALGVLCKNLRESNGVIKFCDEVLINFVKNKINIFFWWVIGIGRHFFQCLYFYTCILLWVKLQQGYLKAKILTLSKQFSVIGKLHQYLTSVRYIKMPPCLINMLAQVRYKMITMWSACMILSIYKLLNQFTNLESVWHNYHSYVTWRR